MWSAWSTAQGTEEQADMITSSSSSPEKSSSKPGPWGVEMWPSAPNEGPVDLVWFGHVETSNNFYLELELLIPFLGMHLITRVFMCVHDVHCIMDYYYCYGMLWLYFTSRGALSCEEMWMGEQLEDQEQDVNPCDYRRTDPRDAQDVLFVGVLVASDSIWSVW